MKNNEIVTIPFVAHESSMNRMERSNKRLIVIAIIELIVILTMFAGIMIYFYLPTEVEETSTNQDVNQTENSEIHQSIGE
jgi:flagellar basal body-associated protein FliL